MLEYFKELLCDELHGAKEYIKLALEFKATYPSWGNTFVDMSAMELEHATNIYKMAESSYKETIAAYNEPPKYLKDLWDCMVEMYTEKSAKVRYMHEMYNK